MIGNLDRTSAKILVLGDSGVGKSSLIHLLCHSSTLSSAQWTIGCSIDAMLYSNHYLEFWDIGGSRSHKIARRFLYQNYRGMILVFDSTNKKSRLNLNEWLLEVAQKTNDKDLNYRRDINVPALLVGTKKDMLPYQSQIELENDSILTNSYPGNSSVVDFNDSLPPGATAATTTSTNLQTKTSSNNSYLYRRLHTSDYSLSSSSPSSTSSCAASYHSMPTQLSTGQFSDNEFSLSNQQSVIYVNTQDVLSFCPGSKNHQELEKFFKCVIKGLNNRVYI